MSGIKPDNKVKDTPEQRQLAQVAAEKWNFAQKNLAPLEDEYMRQVNDMTDPSRMSYIRGQASQGAMQGQSDLLGQGASRLNQAGIDPSSGRATTAMSGLTDAAALSGGDTMGRAQFSQENEQIRGLQNITAMGQGQATQAQAGLSGVASQSAADARDSAVTNYNRNNANLQLLGTGAGLAASYGMDSGQGLALGGTAAPGYTPAQGLDLYGN